MKAAKKKAKGSKAKSKAVKAKSKVVTAKSKKSKKKKAKKTAASPSGDQCYTKVGGDPTVTIWEGGFIVGEMSLEEAKARGIPPCG